MPFVIQSETVITSSMTPIRIPNYAFVDGQNVESHFYNNQLSFDWLKLFNYFKVNLNCQKVFLFLKGQNPNSNHIKNLQQIGFYTIFGNAKAKNDKGRISYNIDSELIIFSLQRHYEIQEHNLILGSGDGDFRPLVSFYEKKKLGVRIVSPSKKCTSEYLEYSKFLNRPREITFLDHPEILKIIQ